jgi:hypothetical protein
MVVLLHGVAGGFDELIIAVVAFGVLWVAVKLAGRKPASDGEEAAEPGEVGDPAEAQPPAAPRS